MAEQHYRSATYVGNLSLGSLVKRAHLLCRNELEAVLERHGLTFMQWVTLIYIRDGLASTPRDLCAYFHIDSGGLTRLLDQLEERGWIERNRCREDRRAVKLRLTDAGRKTVEAQLPFVIERLNGALRNFTDAEFATLLKLLIKFVEGIETVPTNP